MRPSPATERRQHAAARRAARSGSGPTQDAPHALFPGARDRFALFGEVLLIGLIITITSLPLVTLPAALAAGIRHLRRLTRAEDARFALYVHDVRRALAGGAVVGIAALVATAILLLDIDLARSGFLPGAALVETIGWLGLAVLGTALLAMSAAWAPETGWRPTARAALRTVRADPRGGLLLTAAAGFVVVITWALPPLIIAGLGCAALAAVAAPERARRRVSHNEVRSGA